MIGNAIDHFGFAGAADAFGTGEGDVDAGVEQYVQNALARRHGNSPPTAMQPHLKAVNLNWRRIFCHHVRPVLPNARYSA